MKRSNAALACALALGMQPWLQPHPLAAQHRASSLRVDVGSGMAGLDLGAEVIPLPRSMVSPFASVGGGVMGEEGYSGTFGRVTGGMQLRANHRYTLRAFIQRGSHGGQRGPHLMGAGLEYRFGPGR